MSIRTDGARGQETKAARRKRRTPVIFPRRLVPKKRAPKKQGTIAQSLAQLEHEVPHPILSTQYRVRDDYPSPERRLLLAVLDDGIRCAYDLGPADDNSAPGLALDDEDPRERLRDARRWIRANSSEVKGFRWLVDLVGMDADTLSVRLLGRSTKGRLRRA